MPEFRDSGLGILFLVTIVASLELAAVEIRPLDGLVVICRQVEGGVKSLFNPC